ncbi:MAG TPA: class I SAM-dependent methyltransferase [Haloplasmataceae bacterium]
MRDIKDFYNKTASEWANNGYEDESLHPYLQEFLSYLPKNPRILDLCCGAGYESMRMHKLGAIVTGLDFSEESIKIAKEHNPNLTFVVDDMLNDFSYLGKFAGCAVIAGLVHIPSNKLALVFDNIYKVLYDEGVLFIVVKDGIGKSQRLSYQKIEDEDYDREFYFHTLDELKDSSRGKFHFIKELIYEKDSFWKYYLFQKCHESR